MKHRGRLTLALALLAGALMPAGARAEPLIALAPGNSIVVFDSAMPTWTATRPLTGLAGTPGEALVGIDTRPATEQVVAASVDSAGVLRLYVVDPNTGAAAPLGTSTPPPTFPAGVAYGVDFNPVSDRLRLVNAANGNARVNPANMFVLTDANLHFNSPAVGPLIEVAHDRNVAGGTQTTVYGLDAGSSRLVTLGGVNGTPSANGGEVLSVGPLGSAVSLAPGGTAGFDISPTGTAFAAMRSGNTTRLHTVNLATGTASTIEKVGPGTFPVLGLTVSPVPLTLPPLPKCAGKRATKVGSTAHDVIGGTNGRDVIVARGGADVVAGNGGNDILCGNAGKDRLRAGNGNDRLIGGAGRGDECTGGKGRDRSARSCEIGRPSGGSVGRRP